MLLVSSTSTIAQDTCEVSRHFFIAVDISKPILSFTLEDIQQYEMAIGLNSGKKYYPTLDLGYVDAFFSRNNYDLKITGAFFKMGMDRVVIREGNDNFGYGFRLAVTKYNLSYQNALIADSYFSNIELDLKDSKPLGLWAETILKLNIKLAGNFSFGWATRIKIPLYLQKDEYFKPYYVPGYGKKLSDAMVGFNYYIFYKIPY